MRSVYALLAVVALVLLGWLSAGLPLAAGVVLPGLALAVFLVGFVYRVVVWGRAPVPFNITTVAGQQSSLSWIRHSPLDSPRNGREALLRLFLDVVRSGRCSATPACAAGPGSGPSTYPNACCGRRHWRFTTPCSSSC